MARCQNQDKVAAKLATRMVQIIGKEALMDRSVADVLPLCRYCELTACVWSVVVRALPAFKLSS